MMMKKNDYMAIIIKNHLETLGPGKHLLKSSDARKLHGMDNYASNTCYKNVCLAMDKVAKQYHEGKALNNNNQSSTYEYEYIIK